MASNGISTFDAKNIERLAKKASEKGVKSATQYLRTVAKNSVKRNGGREKKYDLKMFLTARDKSGNIVGERTMDAKEYFSRPNRAKEKVVRRDTRKDVIAPKEQGSYLQKTSSRAGQLPKSHKTKQPGHIDYWLKKSIQHDKKGKVFVNPLGRQQMFGLEKPLPQLIEDGGRTMSHIKKLEGYFVHKKRFKNGKVTVSYTPVYSRKVKSYQAKPRPFLKPALEKAAKKLLEILKNNIGK